jgi:AmmeMemoRadiSam system protein A
MKSKVSKHLLFFIAGGVLMISFCCQASSENSGKKPGPGLDAGSQQSNSETLPSEIKSFLLKLARKSLEASVMGSSFSKPENPPEITRLKQGCFVTLTIDGELRGCIGYIEGIKPLWEAVIDNARNAAISDPRFPSVIPQELSRIKIEISVLTPPQPLPFSSPDDLLNKLVPGVDGIILQKGYHQSTFLPQVWEELQDKISFLQHLSLKGGMPIDGWKTASVKRYRALHFQEP